jgi:hypothetical protein
VHLALADIYRDKKNAEACFKELELALPLPIWILTKRSGLCWAIYPKFPEPNAKASALELSRF